MGGRNCVKAVARRPLDRSRPRGIAFATSGAAAAEPLELRRALPGLEPAAGSTAASSSANELSASSSESMSSSSLSVSESVDCSAASARRRSSFSWYFLALLCLPAFSACLSLRSYCSIFSDM